MSDATDLIDAQIAAYRERDVEGFLSFYAPTVTIRSFAGNTLMDGVDAMRGMYGQLFKGSPNLSVEIVARLEVGSFVVDVEHIEGFNLPGFPSTMDAGVVYEIQNGKIANVTLLP